MFGANRRARVTGLFVQKIGTSFAIYGKEANTNNSGERSNELQGSLRSKLFSCFITFDYASGKIPVKSILQFSYFSL